MRVRGTIAATFLAAAVLAGCGAAEMPPDAAPSAGQVGVREERQLDAYAKRCESRLDRDYQRAVIHYPSSLPASMSRASAYVAALDLRVDPPPSGAVIHSENGVTERISVKCVVAARLNPVGTDLDVTPGDDWQYQEWSPTGVVKFAWSVTPKAPNDGQLQLDVRPAVKGYVVEPSVEPVATYITDVNVEASPIQELWYWTQSEWKLVAAIAVVFGGAFLGLLRWGKKARDGIRELFRRAPSSSTTEDRETAATTETSSSDEPASTRG